MIDCLPEGWQDALAEGYRKLHGIPPEEFYKNEPEKIAKFKRQDREHIAGLTEKFIDSVQSAFSKEMKTMPNFIGSIGYVTSKYASLIKASDSEDTEGIQRECIRLATACLRLYIKSGK